MVHKSVQHTETFCHECGNAPKRMHILFLFNSSFLHSTMSRFMTLIQPSTAIHRNNPGFLEQQKPLLYRPEATPDSLSGSPSLLTLHPTCVGRSPPLVLSHPQIFTLQDPKAVGGPRRERVSSKGDILPVNLTTGPLLIPPCVCIPGTLRPRPWGEVPQGPGMGSLDSNSRRKVSCGSLEMPRCLKISGEGSEVNSYKLRRDKKPVIIHICTLSIYYAICLWLTMTVAMGSYFHVLDVETEAERFNNLLEGHVADKM